MTSPTVGRRREGSDITASQSLAASWWYAGVHMAVLLSLFLIPWPGLPAFRSMCPTTLSLCQELPSFIPFWKILVLLRALFYLPLLVKKPITVWDMESNACHDCGPEACFFFGISSTKIIFSPTLPPPSSYLPSSLSELPELGFHPMSPFNGKEDDILEEKHFSSFAV